MAAEMIRLFYEDELAQAQALVMAGHEDGILTFGATVAEAVQRLLDLQVQLQHALPTPMHT
jgi:L-ribulose-5-phosphate 4-epimerase